MRAAVGVKSVSMLPVKEITAVTGYIRGGCTAIGMKKQYSVTLSEKMKLSEQIYVSGGRRGVRLRLAPQVKRAKRKFTVHKQIFKSFKNGVNTVYMS